MGNRVLPYLLAVVVAGIAASALAGDQARTAAQTTTVPNVIEPALDIDVDAAAAVATIERFTAALSAGEVDKAVTELDPRVLIYESGGVERSRTEYLAAHAAADAEFLKGARVELKSRSAHAAGDLAWVSSQSEIQAANGGKKLTVDSTETMVLRRIEGEWKIVHIHWSSGRPRPETSD